MKTKHKVLKVYKIPSQNEVSKVTTTIITFVNWRNALPLL